MLKNYFKTAWRNLRRNKVFSFINIIGLSIGISASLIIYLLVDYDLSFDKAHKNGDKIYRVVSNFIFSGNPFYTSGVALPLPDAVRRDLTGLDEVVPLYVWDKEKLSIPGPGNDQPVVFRKQDHIAFADSNYFHLFPYEWLAGSPQTSLLEPYQAVLTESGARLYFPKLSPGEVIGKELDFNDTVRTTVTGIVRDPSNNTDLTFRIFISRSTLENTSLKPEEWTVWSSTGPNSQLFVRLGAGVSPQRIEAKIDALAKKYGKDEPGTNFSTSYKLQPLSDLHFNSIYGNFFHDDHLAHRPTLYGLQAVAAFLLLLACINFINLTTAQGSQRAKEIGIRKTIGSSRRQLLFQFLSETFLLTLLAALLSVLIAPFLLTVFADYIPQGLHFSAAAQPGAVLFLVILLPVVSLLSGLYPAAILSSYKPVQILKNKGQGGRSGSGWLRKTLTVSQFVIAQVFIIATILVSRQIHFSLHTDMGFKKDAVVFAETNYYDTSRSHRYALVEKLKAIPGIDRISLSNGPPTAEYSRMSSMKYKDGKKENETFVTIQYADMNYLRLYQIKLLAGHDLPYSDTVNSLIINETYAHTLGFADPAKALGKLIEWGHKQYPIIGVVKDFHQKSLHTQIKPQVIASTTSQQITVNVALVPQNPEGTSWKATLAKMAKAWAEVYPDWDFDYKFQDEAIAKLYKSEQDIAHLLTWATGLAIFISCLGLLGLVIYITNQRTKEIGIRKIVGASVAQIIALLSADFVKLIGLAFLIAVPIAWWAAHKWLEGFAYRTALSWWIFFAGGLLMLLIAFVILLLRTVKAAMANPADSLRAE